MRKYFALAATGIGMIGALVAAPSAVASTGQPGTVSAPRPASAQSCSAWSPTANGEGAGFINTTIQIRTGPGIECGSRGTIYAGTEVYYRCITVNQYGNTWIYYRIAGTSTYGWAYTEDVDGIY